MEISTRTQVNGVRIGENDVVIAGNVAAKSKQISDLTKRYLTTKKLSEETAKLKNGLGLGF